MKKIIFLLLCFVFISHSAYAAVIRQNDMEEIVINGTVVESGSREVVISIFGPFEAKQEYDKAIEYTDKMYVNTLYAYDPPEYTFSYKPEQKNMYYAISVTNSGIQETAEIFFVSNDLISDVLKELNAAADVQTIFEKSEYAEVLVNNYKSFTLLSENQKDCVYNVINNKKNGGYKNFEEFEDIYLKATAVQSINNASNTEEIKKIAAENLPIDEVSLYDTFTEFDSTQQERVFERMMAREIEGIDEFYQMINESIFLEKIQNEDFSANLTDFIVRYANEIDLSLGNYTSQSEMVNRTLNKKYFKTISEFKNVFAVAVQNQGGASSGTGASSGGGTGGGEVGKGTFYVTPTPSVENTEKEKAFDDLKNVAWAEGAILYLAEQGIVSGKEYRKFCPNDLITREEFVKMVVDAFNITDADGQILFEDVKVGSWYYPAVVAAVNSEIIKGITETEFGTGRHIIRQDISAILYRIAVMWDYSFEDDGTIFADDQEISDYAKTCVYALRSAGVVSGFENNTFKPKDNATRAQAAMMIYTMMEVLK